MKGNSQSLNRNVYDFNQHKSRHVEILLQTKCKEIKLKGSYISTSKISYLSKRKPAPLEVKAHKEFENI